MHRTTAGHRVPRHTAVPVLAGIALLAVALLAGLRAAADRPPSSSQVAHAVATESAPELPMPDDARVVEPDDAIPMGEVPVLDEDAGTADGRLPGGASPFDVTHAGVANLDADLLGALRAATAEATTDGIQLHVNSGWRSAAYQERLLREAVAEYGSEESAMRWVASPATSAHVSGDAVDIGPADAAAWLAARGHVFGLCQVYDNEPWHFELRPEAMVAGCPPTYSDPTQDPRMQP